MSEKLKERIIKYLCDKPNGCLYSKLIEHFNNPNVINSTEELVKEGFLNKKSNNIGNGKNEGWYYFNKTKKI